MSEEQILKLFHQRKPNSGSCQKREAEYATVLIVIIGTGGEDNP
jgi:hypothetical protein